MYLKKEIEREEAYTTFSLSILIYLIIDSLSMKEYKRHSIVVNASKN